MRILAVLQEAGEENAAALLNTVTFCTGDINEPTSLGHSLRELLNLSLIHLAENQDNVTLRWKPLALEESYDLIKRLPDHLSWSVRLELWQWTKGDVAPQVLLTDKGIRLAERILSEFGWELAEPRRKRQP